MNKYYIYFLVIITFSSCIEPLPLYIDGSGSNILVVEGFIHTGEGPYGFTLTRSASYGGLVSLEDNAVVSIRDDLGSVEFLEEVRTGVYRTSEFYKPEVGRSYVLQIKTENGERYSSTPEKILPVPKIDSLFAIEGTQITDNDFQENVGLEVFAQFQDVGQVDNYYLWSFKGHYEINANPELHTHWGLPDPKECCATCWATEFVLFPNITDDQIFDGVMHSAPVAFIIDDGIKFVDKYMITVNQYSLSKDAYRFYQIINQQLDIDGDIFDPPPATIRGNMINLDNPDSPVIGYFRASDVSQDTLIMYRSDMINPAVIKTIKDDCRTVEDGTTDRPDFWF